MFVEKKPNCNVVNHIDGNKLNNDYRNLEWVTSSENNAHAFRSGLKKPTVRSGKDNWNTKLTNEDVAWIRTNYVRGSKEYGQCALARKLGVTQSSIWAVVHDMTHVCLGRCPV